MKTTLMLVMAMLLHTAAVVGPALGAPSTGGNSTNATARTWKSGAAGSDVANGQFAAWRGSPTPIAGTWNTGAGSEAQWTLTGEYKNWKGDIDNAMGVFTSGSWAQAARGEYDARWRTALTNMAAARAGKPGVVYIRLAHEMNGDWYEWSVNSRNVKEFKAAWVRFAGLVRTNFPKAKIVFGANCGSNSDIGVPAMWPGDDYVDVVGVDFYDMWPNLPDQATWDARYMARDHGDSPLGIGAWLAFAKAHGKPLALPEWGLNWADDKTPGPQDNPFFIQKMNEFFRTNAGEGPGQVLYEIYYNINDVKAQLHPVASNPKSSERYKSLTWGH
jgi:hypothetical protein